MTSEEGNECKDGSTVSGNVYVYKLSSIEQHEIQEQVLPPQRSASTNPQYLDIKKQTSKQKNTTDAFGNVSLLHGTLKPRAIGASLGM